MQLLLRWLVTLGLGFAGFLFGGLQLAFRFDIAFEMSWSRLIYFADRFFWIGIASTGFILFDFIRRGTTVGDQAACTGSMFTWLLTFNSLLMIALSISFGMIIMADAPAVVERVRLPLINGYGVVLVASILLPLVYVLRIDLKI